MRVYLDVCCLNRPLDDQGQERIRLETAAILRVFARFEEPGWSWIASDIVDREVERTPDRERREFMQTALQFAATRISVDVAIQERARQVQLLGLDAADALHIACAESARADVFLTVDQVLLRRAARVAADLHVPVRNPREWLEDLRGAR
jgi:predicted nucleic acid-binding protein